jgi:hypothetical protein
MFIHSFPYQIRPSYVPVYTTQLDSKNQGFLKGHTRLKDRPSISTVPNQLLQIMPQNQAKNYAKKLCQTTMPKNHARKLKQVNVIHLSSQLS